MTVIFVPDSKTMPGDSEVEILKILFWPFIAIAFIIAIGVWQGSSEIKKMKVDCQQRHGRIVGIGDRAEPMCLSSDGRILNMYRF